MTMSSDTTTRRAFLVKSAAAGAAVAGAELLASTVEAAAPAAQGETAQQVVYWDWWSPVGNARMGRRYAWIKETFEKENPGVMAVISTSPTSAVCSSTRPRPCNARSGC